MTTVREINQEDVPVTQNDVTNHNGHVFRIADFPKYSGHGGDEILGEVENLIDEYVFASPQQISLLLGRLTLIVINGGLLPQD